MGVVTVETTAYVKMVLHAAKYPHCAVNGVLLADGSTIKEGAKNQDIDILDTIPLFHHSHYVSPMAEIALTQIEALAQAREQVIAGYYAACENIHDNTVDKCPGQRIADKIAEHFPSAVFFVLDNNRISPKPGKPAINLHKFIDGKWKLQDDTHLVLESPFALQTTSLLMQGVQKELIDFDNYLDDPEQDWTNEAIDTLIDHVTPDDVQQSEGKRDSEE